MLFRRLRPKHDGSAEVTVPKQFLEQDGIIDDDTEIEDVNLNTSWDRLGENCYLVRVPQDGDLPDARETEEVRQLAAQIALDQSNAFAPSAD